MKTIARRGLQIIIILSLAVAGIGFLALWLPTTDATIASQAILPALSPTPTETPDPFGPLPTGCPGGLLASTTLPVCCGIVYMDGQPVEGATVEIVNTKGEVVQLETYKYRESPIPHYRYDDQSGLSFDVGQPNVITVTARYSGHMQRVNYIVQPGEQRVDVVLRRNFTEDYMFDRQSWQRAPSGVLNEPTDVAVDSAGNLYVVDRANARIQVFDPNGQFLHGWGALGDLPGQFRALTGIALDRYDNIYVTDSGSHRIQKFARDGVLLGAWGSQGSGDGQFESPQGIAIDNRDQDNIYVYVADTGNNRIQKFDKDGKFLQKWGAQGSENEQFLAPGDVSVDSSGKFYVVDTGNHRIQIFGSDGNFITTWGVNESIHLSLPLGISVDISDTVYVADTGNHRIQKIRNDGILNISVWGVGGQEDGEFSAPGGLSVDSRGHVYVADTGNHRIQEFDSAGNFVSVRGSRGSGNGQFESVRGIGMDREGHIYAADTGNHRIQKFKSDGTFLQKWGRPDGQAGSADGEFSSPAGVSVDSNGNVYVADTGNHRIQKFDSNGNFIRKWGDQGNGDGQFESPQGIAIDNNSYVYVADTNNHRIQKFDSNGNFIRKWGDQGNGDGQFESPQGIAIDNNSYVYVADTNNHRIQKFDNNGGFIDVWGGHEIGLIEFKSPQGVSLDSSGNLYVADTGNNQIQKFRSDGERSSAWGWFPGIDPGESITPTGIIIHTNGHVYVADTDHHRIQPFHPMTYTRPIATISHLSDNAKDLPPDEFLKVLAQGQESDEDGGVISYHLTFYSLITGEQKKKTTESSDPLSELEYPANELVPGWHRLTLVVEDEEGELSKPVEALIRMGKEVFLPIVRNDLKR